MRPLFGLLLILFPYVGIYNFTGSPSAPTWRLANAALVILWCAVFPIWKGRPMRVQAGLILSLLIAVAVQITLAYKPVELRDVVLLLGLGLLLASTLPIMSIYRGDPAYLLRLLRICVYLAIAYQAWQIFAFVAFGRDYVTILNDRTTVASSNFFRLIGGFLGAPSFMAESGHLAMLVGPVAMIMQLASHYRVDAPPRYFTPLSLASLIATTSTGALIYVALIGGVWLACRMRSAGAMLLTLLAAAAGGVVLSTMLGDADFWFGNAYGADGPNVLAGLALAIRKINNPDGQPRLVSALMYLKAAMDEPSFGYGFGGDLLYVNADPNMLWPVTLMNHGIPVTGMLIAMIVLPILAAAVRSDRKLFVLPFVAVLLHVSSAYGSYLWPAMWIVQAVCVAALWGDRPSATPEIRAEMVVS